jgi:quercetin dioxygenase-like cupin family protein
MGDTTVKKVVSEHSPRGEMGQTYLVTGKALSLRLWQQVEPGETKPERSREYETAGYVIAGRAELHLEGQVIHLDPGDSWLVPQGASHTYKILETFTALEATAPPGHLHDRDQAPTEQTG